MKWLEVGLKQIIGWTMCVRWKSWIPHITIHLRDKEVAIGLFIEYAKRIPGIEKCKE